VRIGLIQQNYLVGDLSGNREKIFRAVAEAPAGVDLFVTSELALQGYPPRDLLLYHRFVERSLEAVETLAQKLTGFAPLLLGGVEFGSAPKRLHNCAFLLHQGKVVQRFRKTLLPNYDIFDERRYFEPGQGAQSFLLDGQKIGVTICEDVWAGSPEVPFYDLNPVGELRGVDLMVNLSASPFVRGKQAKREMVLGDAARALGVPTFYANQVGGTDHLVFDGSSFALDGTGALLGRAKAFAEDLLVVDPDLAPQRIEPKLGSEEEVWRALVLGVKDYAAKCGFKTAVLGLSGGIDSALTAVIAAQALGADQVTGLLLPSPYSSPGSVADSLALAQAYGIKTTTLPIGPMMVAMDLALAPSFEGLPNDVTEENLQARIRGNLLMAFSNKFGSLLLTTGNKSELSVGYCTLYGDMSGGLAVISDLYKTEVYRLCHWLNQTQGGKIPEAILTKAPSAELRPGQTDQDSLPDYDTLDAVLHHLIEERKSAAETAAQGFDLPLVERINQLLSRAEFKRQQAAPGIKVSTQAFGGGWRMPIAASKTLF